LWESKKEFNWVEVNKGLARGEIFVIMGIGGSHIVSNALNTDKIQFLRENKRKKSDKPFAVMMQNIETISKYCITTEKDERILTSVRRPILILPIREEYLDDFEYISPGLLTLGVMLPYTGMHYNLFDKDLTASTEVLLMTSANELGVPMPITQESIMADTSIFQFADKIMIHNRKIAQRVDDSVIRSHGDNHLLIRRSRGYVPQPLYLQSLEKYGDMISLGAEENNTGAIMKNGWVVPSQHIGHIQNYECLSFLESSLDHLVDLFNLNPKYLVLDLHPDFLNRKLIPNYLELRIIEVQHHLAHVASLSLDNNMEHSEPILAWALDGYGYGSDGQAWGGELIYLNNGDWNRVASITPLGYDGADVNAKYPGRMLLKYMIASELTTNDFFTDDKLSYYFKHGSREFNVLNKIGDDKLITTSVARLLDSVSALLGVSNFRSYRGEPAIKLEDMALRYKHKIKFDDDYIDSFVISGSLPKIDTISIFKEIYENHKNNMTRIKTAYLTHELLGSSLARLGMIIAEDFDLNKLGLTGGVAFNKLITQSMQDYLEHNKFGLLTHNHLSPGDAGISAGQLNYAGMILNI
jgi:hydrogenase maturation protein HypF